MGLQRFYPIKDTFITNKIMSDGGARATGSNFGSNPTLQAYKVTSSYPNYDAELARSLLLFNYADLSGAVYLKKTIPSSSVSYVLKAFNYDVHDTVPQSFDIDVVPISGGWDEGIGQDDKNYVDSGYANWVLPTSTRSWNAGGGDFYAGISGSQHFDAGTEDLEIDVTPIVQGWLSGTIAPNGLMLKLSKACESNANDYWRKVFYSSETHYVENVPFLEARWNDVRKDNRRNFALNQPNALYLYNFVRGSLQNVAGTPTVRIQDNIIGISASFQATYNASQVETGVYSVPVMITSSLPGNFSSSWLDIWSDSNGMCLMSGNLFPLILTGSQRDPYHNFVVDADNLKPLYRTDEQARIQVNVRTDYRDHIAIHTASLMTQREYMEDMYYSVVNNETGATIIPFGTGSVPYTKLSYNADGNYFQLGMDSFVPGFTYRLLFLIQYNKYEKDIIDEKMIFKVL